MLRSLIRTSLVILSPCLLSALMTACGPSGAPPEEYFIQEARDRFTAAVNAERDFDIYWLGPSFEVDRMTWEGPEVVGFADEVSRDSLETDYVNRGSTCCGTVSVDMYTEAAWELVQQTRGSVRNFDIKQVRVGRYTGELRTGHGGVQPISSQVLVLHIGDTVVEAVTGAVVPLTPTPSQPNPMIDEATFLSVMEQLRPYPD